MEKCGGQNIFSKCQYISISWGKKKIGKTLKITDDYINCTQDPKLNLEEYR